MSDFTLSNRCPMLLLSFIVFLSGAVSASAVEPFEAFLNKHCVRCHGPQKEEGDIRIDRLSRDFKSGVDTHHWAEALDKLNSGEMPPKRRSRRRTRSRRSSRELDTRLKEGRAARMAARPAVAHYRLSRKEYQNTVYDLLGVRYDPAKPGELNEDTLWHGFERIGSQLSLSPSHVDRYYRAADIVLDRAFPATSSEARKVRKTARTALQRREATTGGLDRFGIKRPLRYLLFPGRVQHALSVQLVWQDGAGAQRSLQARASGQRHPPARRPAGPPQHRQADQ